MSVSQPRVWTILTLTVAVSLSGCLQNLGGGDLANDALGTLPAFERVCQPHDGPAINPETGAIATICNLHVAKGARPVNEPSIAINPKDPLNLIAGANDYNLAMSDGYPFTRTVWTGVYVSKDGGHTWKQGWIPGYPGGPVSSLTGQTDAGDAAIAFAPDGTAYYAGIAFKRTSASAGQQLVGGAAAYVFEGPTLFIARSRDGGTTWDQIATPVKGVGPLVTVLTPVGYADVGATLFQDKEMITVGPDGTVYVTWTSYTFSYADVVTPLGRQTQGDYTAPIMMIKSTDAGTTWSQPVKLSQATDNQGSIPAVTPDGRLVVAWSEFPDHKEETTRILVRTSDDKGATFSAPVKVAEFSTVQPTHRTRTGSFPSLAVDTSSGEHRGRLSLVWAGNVTGDHDVYLSQSMDGKVWSAPVRVNQDPVGNGRPQYMPWVAVGPDGTTHIVYFDGRDDVRNLLIGVYLASTQDGVNFVDRPATDAPFAADPDGFAPDNFLGDYLGIAASDRGVYPIWPDTRTAKNPNTQQDLGRSAGDLDLFTAHFAPQRLP